MRTFTFNKSIELFTSKWKLASNTTYVFSKEIWKPFLKNELKARTHSIQVYDHRGGIYCIITNRRDNGKGGNAQIVKFGNNICTCGKWVKFRFSCSHVFAACYRSDTNSYHLIGYVHIFSTWQSSLQGQFQPLPNSAYWVPSELRLTYDVGKIK